MSDSSGRGTVRNFYATREKKSTQVARRLCGYYTVTRSDSHATGETHLDLATYIEDVQLSGFGREQPASVSSDRAVHIEDRHLFGLVFGWSRTAHEARSRHMTDWRETILHNCLDVSRRVAVEHGQQSIRILCNSVAVPGPG